MIAKRVIAAIALGLSSIGTADAFDVLVLECRITLPDGFEADVRGGRQSTATFRHMPEGGMELTVIVVSSEGEWRSDNPLESASYEILSHRVKGKLEHFVVRPVMDGFNANEIDLITDGSAYVKVMGDNRQGLVDQLLECRGI